MQIEPKDQMRNALQMEQELLAQKATLHEAITATDDKLNRVRAFLDGIKLGMSIPAEEPEADEA